MPFTPKPVPTSLDGPACTVQMTQAQALLIKRAMLLLIDKDQTLTEDEHEEAQTLADMAVELTPDGVHGWCL